MKTEFNAYQAAVLADDVYALARLRTIADATKYMKTEHGDIFKFDGGNLVKGATGGPGMFKVRTAFGFTLLGQGALKGHAVILFRGTQYLADWLTNFNITVSRSAVGEPVHDGFNQSFKTMEPHINEFMKIVKKSNVHTVHCIGHSLGGALATICAEWIHKAHKIRSYLYSFGSPRVGLQTFVTATTRDLGAERIFRAYHRTDLVPCIPIWPFIHTPNSGRDYFLPSPGIIPAAEYHGMNHYINSVEGKSWDALARLKVESNQPGEVERWLREDSPLGLTISSIEMLNKALLYVLDKCLKGAAWIISRTATTTFTLMDQLAMVLKKGVNLAENISSLVLYLMRKIMRMLGLGKIVEAADLTRSFIRRVLTNLQNSLQAQTQQILSNVLVNGRAV